SEMELFETGTYTREVEDLREILSRLTREDLPGAGELAGSRVGLLAHSRGAVSALAVAAARELPVASVALWDPVPSVLWGDVAAGAKGALHASPETGHTFGAAHPFGPPTRALEDALRVTREHFERTLGRAAA